MLDPGKVTAPTQFQLSTKATCCRASTIYRRSHTAGCLKTSRYRRGIVASYLHVTKPSPESS